MIVDLDGGNDALNTVIPIADPLYRKLRPALAIPRQCALPLDADTALHPSLLPLMTVWHANELAIVRGVGVGTFDRRHQRSHYRSRQIWDTASDADEYRRDGWLERAHGSRAYVQDVIHSRTFVAACDAAARRIETYGAHGATDGVNVIPLTLHGFDTHENQAHRHASLLAQFAEGIALLRARLIASGDWAHTLVMTRSDFGRSAHENAARGTEHGAAGSHFMMGGHVRGGLFGAPPRLDALDDEGGLPVGIDFRTFFATALDACGHTDLASIFGQGIEPLRLLRA
ncbi:PF07394 family protein [Caballeronia peredens]|nr:PF07394 family protein [Caballeronia peredens]